MNDSILKIALDEYGVTEQKGSSHNRRILKYFKDIGHAWVKDDETAWCSCFVNWVAMQAGCKISGKLTARSWLAVGIEAKAPKVGDVVVFWREHRSSWKGHVGFYISHSKDGKWVYCLGGNQSNQVNIRAYAAHRLLSYRRLEKA